MLKNKCKTCKKEFYHYTMVKNQCEECQSHKRNEVRTAWDRFWKLPNMYNTLEKNYRIPINEYDLQIYEWCNMKMKEGFINNKAKYE